MKTKRVVLLLSNDKRYDIYTWFFPLAFLFFFAALRGNGSGDYWNYLRRGSAIRSIHDIIINNIHLDYGYCVLAWIVNFLHLPAQTVIALMNVISFYCIGKFIARYSLHPALSILIFLPFFFQFDMHAARTACAIGVFTLSTPYILERKPFKFIIVVSIAVLFHAEALIGLFIYPLSLVKIDMHKGIMILLFACIIALLNVVDRMCILIFQLLGMERSMMRFLTYASGGSFSYSSQIYDPRFILYFIIFVFASVVLFNKKNSLERLLINTSFLTIFLMVFFIKHAFMVYRLSSFYGIFSIILLPMLLTETYNQKKRFSSYKNYLIVVVAYTLLSCAHAVRMSVPYKLFEIEYW